jgi:Proton-conducting membrane transporter
VNLLPFLAIAFGAAAASLLTRRTPALSATIGILGLAAAAVTASTIIPDSTAAVGGGELRATAYIRLFAMLGSVVGLALVVLGLATTSHRHVPGVLLGGIGAAVLALALPDAQTAVIAATAGGLIGILVTLGPPTSARGVLVGIRELRALAVAGSLAILAAAWIGRPLDQLLAEPAVFGLAYLGFAVAVAIRFGAIPFHFWAARLADAAPEISLPMLMAWGPAAFGIVALTWVDQSVAPLALPLTAERALVVAVGGVSVILGSLAAWIQDDLEHIVGYTIIADAGVAILGLAVFDATAWEPARTWILVFVMTRSAFAAWAIAVRGAFGTRRIAELSGWILRAPLLAVALAVIVVASIGWPGFVAWEARATLIDKTVGWPLAILVTAGAFGPLAAYGRLVLAGLRPPSEAVQRGGSERPQWPAPVPSRPMVGLSPTERAFERTGHVLGGLLDILWAVPGALRANRTLIAALLVIALSGLSFTVAAGGLGLPDAARAAPGQQQGPTESEPPGGESPAPGETQLPVPSEPPLGSEPPASESPPSEPSFQPLPTSS